MSLITPDQKKCIKCGLCAAACPRGLIHLEHVWPEAVDPEICIACGHCVAICPTAALDNERAPLSAQLPLPEYPVLSGKKAYQFLRARRSIRRYKNAPVPREKLLELMDIARFAPTGSNSQGLSYIVIDDPTTLHKITKQTVVWLEEQAKKDSPTAKGYAKYAAIYRASGQDVILRNAPILVLATALRSFPRGKENAHFSLAYVELYATALDLGTCWVGLLMAAAFSDFQPLLDLLPIPKEKCLAGALLVGHPEYRYRRIVDKNPLDITFASPK